MQGACEVLCISPGPLLKKDAISVFKMVNSSSAAADFDCHEMNKFEFVKSIELIAKRIGVSSIEELCFAQISEGTDLAAERERRRVEAQRAADSVLSQVRDLGDLNIQMMKEILKIFFARSDDNAAEPELDIEQFVDIFAPILHQSEREIQLLFMKIDVNSDGVVSWTEFSDFVLNLNAKVTARFPDLVCENTYTLRAASASLVPRCMQLMLSAVGLQEEAAAASDSILENAPPFSENDIATHHNDFIVAMAPMPKFGLIVSAGNDGYLRLWHATSGQSAANRHVRAVPPSKTIMSLAVLQQSSLVVVGADDFKIRFFDPYSLRHELTFDCEGRWPFSMASFMFPDDHDPTHSSAETATSSQDALMFDDPLFSSDKKGYSGWFVWGDGEGEIHFMPEKQLLTFRTQHEVVPFFRSGVRRLWDLKIFRGQEHATGVWVTSLMFLPDVGLAGTIIAAASNGQVCVVSFEQRRVFHYYIQHRLSVKSLAWCGRQNNLLASAGLDRDIHLWRPVAIRNGRPILAGTLTGHGAGVTSLVFHEKRDVLFSLDSHCVTLVWDLSSRTLVTRLQPLTQNPFDISGRTKIIMVNQQTRHLITATNHLKYWGVRALDLRDLSEKLVRHATEIVFALYNNVFDLVVSGDKNGLISLWNIKTGAQIFKFYCESVQETYGLPVISAASFCISQRRLILGWNQGTVQVYNFSNGSILRNLITDTTIAVTAVGQHTFQRSRETHQYFTAAFDDGLLLQWADEKKPSDAPIRKIEVPSWMGLEFSEVGINSMASGSIDHGSEVQSVLVTVRKDGVAFFWDITTGFLVRLSTDSTPGIKKDKKDKNQTQDEKASEFRAPSIDSQEERVRDAKSKAVPRGASRSPDTKAPAKESLCTQISEGPKVETTCVKILHRCEHILFISDTQGLVHIVNMVTGGKVGCILGSSRAGRHLDDEDYVPRINAMEVDFTDSFLIVGDEMGEVQVWDISQMFDDRYHPTMSLMIDAFRWKAHDAAVTQIQHLRKDNLVITVGREERGVCLIWTMAGQKVGSFGDMRWTAESIQRAMEASGMIDDKVEEETYSQPADATPVPLYQKVLDGVMATLEDIGKTEKVEISALKGLIHKNRAQRGIQTSMFREANRSWEPPSSCDTPVSETDAEPISASELRGQLAITIVALQHLPSTDKYSKADPYVRILLGDFPVRRTRTFLNQANATVDEIFLFYVHSLDQRLKIEVWDCDPGGNDDFVGLVDNNVNMMLATSNTVSLTMSLLKRDGTGAGKLGSVGFKIRFEPIRSTFAKDAAQTVSDHIHAALKQQGVVPSVPLISLAKPEPETKDRKVTALATARWKTSDFRHLSVYHLQHDVKFGNGSLTERNTERTRGARASRLTMGEESPFDTNVPTEPRFRFTRETVAGRLERGLDLNAKHVGLASMQSVEKHQISARRIAVKKIDKDGHAPVSVSKIHGSFSSSRPSLKEAAENVILVSGVSRKIAVSHPFQLPFDCENESDRFCVRVRAVDAD